MAESSFYDLLPIELGGAVQTIEAPPPDATDAELLAIPVGSPCCTASASPPIWRARRC